MLPSRCLKDIFCFPRGPCPVWLRWHQERLLGQCWVILLCQQKGREDVILNLQCGCVIVSVCLNETAGVQIFWENHKNTYVSSPNPEPNPVFFLSTQCPEGGAVLWEALLCSAETEGDISSQPEHSAHPRGGAVSVPSGCPAAGAQKIPQSQR